MLSKKSILMISMIMVVVLALVLAGCGGGGGGNNNPGGGNGGDDDGGDIGPIEPADPSNIIGTWKSQGVTPSVEIKIENQIGTSFFYTGKVTCENFNFGYLNITESDNSILSDKYIVAQGVEIEGTTISSIHVRAREEYNDDLLGELANELSLDGFLDGAVLKVVWLEVSRQESGLLYEFDSEGEDDYLTFVKQ